MTIYFTKISIHVTVTLCVSFLFSIFVSIFEERKENICYGLVIDSDQFYKALTALGLIEESSDLIELRYI